MYAIIETGGKQYRVKAGDVVFVEKLEGEAQDSIKFDENGNIKTDAQKSIADL